MGIIVERRFELIHGLCFELLFPPFVPVLQDRRCLGFQVDLFLWAAWSPTWNAAWSGSRRGLVGRDPCIKFRYVLIYPLKQIEGYDLLVADKNRERAYVEYVRSFLEVRELFFWQALVVQAFCEFL